MTERALQAFQATPNGNEQARLWQQAYLAWLGAQDSEQTRAKYDRVLREFLAFLRERYPGITPAEVTGAHCYAWVADLKEPKVRHPKSQRAMVNGPATIKMKLCALSSFFAFACRYEIATRETLHSYNPVDRVERPDVKPYANAKGASMVAVRQLLAACDVSTVIGARDFAILMWFFFTGRRRAAMTRITWGDIRDNGAGYKEYQYLEKRRESHWRELPQPVWEATLAYLRQAGRLESMTPTTPLFTPTNDHALRLPNVRQFLGLDAEGGSRAVSAEVTPGKVREKALDDCTLNVVITRVCKQAGLPRLTVHSLRHAAAQLEYEASQDILSVNRFLDHKSLDVTRIYIGRLMGYKDTTWRRKATLLFASEEAEAARDGEMSANREKHV